MKFPDYPQEGQSVAEWGTQLLNWLRATRILRINGVPAKESPNGSSFEIKVGDANPPAAGSPTGRLVLISASTDDEPPAPAFSVTNGYVNDQIPTLDSNPLDDDPAPVQEITAAKAVWIKVVGTFGTPDTYVITIETSADTSTLPAANDISPTGFTFSKLLGTVDLVDGAGVVTPIYEGGDIACESLGTMIHWWIVTA